MKKTEPEHISVWGIELTDDDINEDKEGEIEEELSIYHTKGGILVGLEPDQMDDDETLYEFKRRISESITNYLYEVDVDDICFLDGTIIN